MVNNKFVFLYTWRYHVAISLRVKMKNGEIKTMILDPSLSPDGPISLTEWLDILRKDSKKGNNEFQIIECDSRIFIINPNNHQEYIFDELKEVYEHGLITKEDYENAYNIAYKIISTYNSHKEDYYEFIYNLYNKYRNKELGNIKSK